MADRKRQSVVTEIKEAERSMLAIKSPQPIGGASFVNYNTYSNDSYDFAATMNATVRSYRITFTFSDASSRQLVVPSFFFRVDNSNVMDAPFIPLTGVANRVFVLPERMNLGYQTWILDCVNADYPTTRTFYLKFFFKGTTAGTFDVVAI